MGVHLGSPLRFYVRCYQHKGIPYIRALHEAGCTIDKQRPDIALLDIDWSRTDPTKPSHLLKTLADRGASILVYPHTATPPWWYDGVIKIQPIVRALLVIGPGQQEAVRKFAPEIKTEVIGWPFCEQKEFVKPSKLRTILFCPIHPANGYLRQEAVDANRSVFEELKQYHKDTRVKVVVRYIGDLALQGLKQYKGFEWIEGATDGSTKDIDNADLVIAEGTCMYISVARGKPTIGINQHIPIWSNVRYEQGYRWHEYGHLMAYPVNFGSAPLHKLIDAAMTEQSKWREMFIGSSMTPEGLLRVVEKYK